MNAELARVAMLCLSAVLVLAVVGAVVVSCLVARKRPEESTAALLSLVEGGNAVRLLTTMGVIVVACFLTLAGSLTDGAIALLSSVAGFMLGGVRRDGPTLDGKDGKDQEGPNRFHPIRQT